VLCRAQRSSLLEALAAKNWTTLRGPERHSRFLAALRARSFCFRAHWRGTATTTLSTLGLATLAPLRFVLETFVGEEHLFAGGKNKLSTTLRTLQDTIVIFHEPLSPCP
jgi:hypothetical protein